MSASIEERASFNYIRYANCWEDAEILVEALNTGPGKRFLSIASAGDNSLALLTLNPSLVVAVDVSRVQLALTEIRKYAFQELDYSEMLDLLGFRNCDARRRVFLYQKVRVFLNDHSKIYWDDHQKIIQDGMIHAGKFEDYFSTFRRRILPLVHRRKTVEELTDLSDLEAQRKFYSERWNNIRWRLLFRIFFSKFVMGKAGRDPEFFKYVKGSVSKKILARTKHALTEIPVTDNPYVQYILHGSFRRALPFYAREENFSLIKKNAPKLEILCGTTDDAFLSYKRKFDGFNLSDIFEYMDEQLFRETAGNILRNANPGARIAYWNLLVPRRISAEFPERAEFLEERSSELFLRDRAFFYSNFFIDQVR